MVAEFGKSGVNGVGVARNGLIFSEDGAMGCSKVSVWLRGLRDTISNSQKCDFAGNPKN